MCVRRLPVFWPQVVVVSLIGLGAAGCSDSGRFGEVFGSDNQPRGEVTGSVTPRGPAQASRIETKPIPPIARNDGGISGGGRGMASYQPGHPEITGSVRASAPPPPAWTWEGGTPIVVGQGETLEMIARKHAVPVTAIVQANNLASPAAIHPGQHLVIPRYRSVTGALPPSGRVATMPAMPGTDVGPPRNALAPSAGTHVVAPGETLNSIARLYGKSVMVLARANNLAPNTMVRVGERLVIPDAHNAPRAEATPPAAPPQQPGPDMASAESPHSAWKASPVEPPVQQSPIKAAEPVGALPSFRWPVRGRIIAAFGATPNGVQNDGIDLAVPTGTPVKAADDGVVAYAGNELKGYGNLVLIRHGNGYVTAYAHASEILVKRGESVKRGQVIAHSGDSGNVKSPELHFEIRKGATPVDPSQFLSGA